MWRDLTTDLPLTVGGFMMILERNICMSRECFEHCPNIENVRILRDTYDTAGNLFQEPEEISINSARYWDKRTGDEMAQTYDCPGPIVTETEVVKGYHVKRIETNKTYHCWRLSNGSE
ncbi:MAG TPA: hypothetical protein VK983_03935 [Candidatus Limnocylindrales bacterium]|nr:hypothetical protein [Candidatus Limnocylindrales bacterium]